MCKKIGLNFQEVKVVTYKCETCNTVFQMLGSEDFNYCPYCGFKA